VTLATMESAMASSLSRFGLNSEPSFDTAEPTTFLG
jgi:hypothetical protein